MIWGNCATKKALVYVFLYLLGILIIYFHTKAIHDTLIIAHFFLFLECYAVYDPGHYRQNCPFQNAAKTLMMDWRPNFNFDTSIRSHTTTMYASISRWRMRLPYCPSTHWAKIRKKVYTRETTIFVSNAKFNIPFLKKLIWRRYKPGNMHFFIELFFHFWSRLPSMMVVTKKPPYHHRITISSRSQDSW